MYSVPHSVIASSMGFKDFPSGVREYSTRGGTSAKTSRSISPSSSSARRLSVSTFLLMDGIVFMKSVNRCLPSNSRLRISRSFHLFPMESCYLSCLALADKNGLGSLAFCCISTGEFHFPNGRAAEIAVKAVQKYKRETASMIKVVFNVFKEQDYEIYARLLGADR